MPKMRQNTGLFGRGADRICAVVAAATARKMAAQVLAINHLTRTIELRLDWLRSDKELVKLLSWVYRHRRSATFIATCRTAEGGGKSRLPGGTELIILALANASGCRWCDVELETFRKVPRGLIRDMLDPARVILSHHDFSRTPDDLGHLLKECRSWEPDVIKIAANARSILDSVRLLNRSQGSRNLIAIPMGEAGLPARILALRAGSALAYAPVGAETAPGQVPFAEMFTLYRAHELTRRTRIYGVIGNPVSHSLSPLLHNTGFIARRVDAVYLPFLVKDLREFLKAVPELGVRGFSVTIPHKQAILRYVHDCDPLAAEIGAVNTVVVRRDGKLYASNTDYVGVLRALKGRLRVAGSRILLFGAGGAARAAAFGLARAGALVAVCARRENRARELARAVSGEAVSRRALRTEQFDAILNTTPVGMHPHVAISPLASRELHCRIAMDMIYRPRITQLLKLAQRKGCQIVSGMEMFLAQGFAQWEMWTEQRAPEAAMRRAVLGRLREEQRAATALERSRPRR